jgi:hypothetical protein
MRCSVIGFPIMALISGEIPALEDRFSVIVGAN